MRRLVAGLATALVAMLLLGRGVQAQPALAAAAAPTEYRLGAGDVVRIAVFQNPGLRLQTRIT